MEADTEIDNTKGGMARYNMKYVTVRDQMEDDAEPDHMQGSGQIRSGRKRNREGSGASQNIIVKGKMDQE